MNSEQRLEEEQTSSALTVHLFHGKSSIIFDQSKCIDAHAEVAGRCQNSHSIYLSGVSSEEEKKKRRHHQAVQENLLPSTKKTEDEV